MKCQRHHFILLSHTIYITCILRYMVVYSAPRLRRTRFSFPTEVLSEISVFGVSVKWHALHDVKIYASRNTIDHARVCALILMRCLKYSCHVVTLLLQVFFAGTVPTILLSQCFGIKIIKSKYSIIDSSVTRELGENEQILTKRKLSVFYLVGIYIQCAFHPKSEMWLATNYFFQFNVIGVWKYLDWNILFLAINAKNVITNSVLR